MICGRSLESREVLEGSFVSNLLDGQLCCFFLKVIRSDKSPVIFTRVLVEMGIPAKDILGKI